MVRLGRVAAGVKPKLYAKLEFFNPGGSVKDRIGLAMVLEAEERGLLKPGYTIVEPTSGNTGMGLAMAAILRGYKVVFTMPDKMSKTKVDLLRAVGAEVRVTPSAPPGHPSNYIEVAKRIAKTRPHSYMPNQYENRANPEAHYATTGPEVWEQTEGRVDVLVAGVGTGGTITGTGRYLKERNPVVKVIGVDPRGSILASAHGRKEASAEAYRIEGIGEDFIPSTLDMDVIDEFVTVGDKEAFLMARRLAREEGILSGSSGGAAVAGALKAARSLGEGKTMVVIIPDTGRSYLNKVFNDDWMAEQGFLTRRSRRLIVASLLDAKPKPLAGLLTCSPSDSVAGAISTMAKKGISNLPVVEDGVVVGNISARSMLRTPTKRGKSKVGDIMEGPLQGVKKSGKVDVPGAVTSERGAVLVYQGTTPVGILTTRDVINYLART